MSMQVIMAPSFLESTKGFSKPETLSVFEFIRIFIENPAHPGISLERMSRIRSKKVWSARITQDLRAVIYREGETFALLFSAHHDKAYQWAENREFGRHPVTGALQIVESIETVREVEKIIETYVHSKMTPLFGAFPDEYLLSLGVPSAWLATLRQIHNEDQLLVVCEKLPVEIAERLLSLGAGDLVTPPVPVGENQPLLDAPDTRLRFCILDNVEGLATAFEAPMESWRAFLHPDQRMLVDKKFNGPVKVSGSAGTGKTVVAMHRARSLARKGEKVLVTSFVTTLCDNIHENLRSLCTPEELKNIVISTVHSCALELIHLVRPSISPADMNNTKKILERFRLQKAPQFDSRFVLDEWEQVLRLQGLESWPEYRSAQRTGRGRGLSVRDRKTLWAIFGATLEELRSNNKLDWTGLCRYARDLIEKQEIQSPFSAVIIDEVQDLKPPELLFLASLCSKHMGNLMVCGDTGQRIYPGGFSLSSLGIEVRGRATVLRVNYRTTEQIRRLADQMLGHESDDMDGGLEGRSTTRSLLRGPEPRLVSFSSRNEEFAAGVQWIMRWLREGLVPDEMAVFSRFSKRLVEFQLCLTEEKIASVLLSKRDTPKENTIKLGTMHRAKGLEFKCVLLLDCKKGSLPSAAVMNRRQDPLDRERAEAREKRLLYVAMTRARDELIMSWSGKPSPFLEFCRNSE